MQMAFAIAEQGQLGPDVGGDALHQSRQAMLVGAVHLTKQLVLDGTEIVLEGFAT